MASYVMLFHYTHQGIEHVKQSPDRVDALKKIFNKHGAKIKDFYARCSVSTIRSSLLMRPTTKRSPNFPCTSLSRATRGSRRTARSPRQNFASCCRRSTNHGCKQRRACQSCVIFNEVTILCATVSPQERLCRPPGHMEPSAEGRNRPAAGSRAPHVNR
jgi:hypothetical protein